MNSRMVISELSAEEFLELAERSHLSLPVEAHPSFNEGGRKVHYLKVAKNPKGVLALIKGVEMKRGYHSVFWARSGPLFLSAPSTDEEVNIRDAVAEWLRIHANSAIYRYSSKSMLEGSQQCHEVGSYDMSVIIPLAESFDETLTNVPKRGRRDLSRARRKSPLRIVDLSEKLTDSLWNELSAVMFESGKRSGFAAMRAQTLQKVILPLMQNGLVHIYGAENENGQIVAWASLYLMGSKAYYFHAAATGEGLSKLGPDLLLNHLISVAVERGCTQFDLVGIGSEIAPHLLHLNRFKTKFGAPTHVPFSQEYVLRRYRYLFAQFLTVLRSTVKRILIKKK